ncbi:hypothetical protein IFM89_038984 [Coptis chinensis]|uniref:Uncharacterized protein n=1 Tax=Coptis chinensis TaxID=261450 RepID=A0A835IJV7_9MAGN|nr:hypothetical protein IFM89_038984 [Coptis chinensis]
MAGLQHTRWSPMMDDILIQVLLEKSLNGTGGTLRNRFDIGTLKEAAKAHPKDKHLRERMFPHFVEACAIFGNDFSHHIVNVDARFGLLSFGDTSQAESVQPDTQVESGERFGGHGESSGVVDDTTSSPLLVEYSFPSVEYSWQ